MIDLAALTVGLDANSRLELRFDSKLELAQLGRETLAAATAKHRTVLEPVPVRAALYAIALASVRSQLETTGRVDADKVLDALIGVKAEVLALVVRQDQSQ